MTSMADKVTSVERELSLLVIPTIADKSSQEVSGIRESADFATEDIRIQDM